MSTLKADTIQSTSGGAATLTKQAAAKVYGFYNQATGESFSVATNTLGSDSLNVASVTDAATGNPYVNFTNAMSVISFSPSGLSEGQNNTLNEMDAEGSPSTSRLVMRHTDSDSNGDVDRFLSFQVHGDLA